MKRILGCAGAIVLGSSMLVAAEATPTPTIKIDGSSTVYPLTEAMAEEFRQINPATRITIGVSGTGGGYKKFVVGEIDITNASRPIKAEESADALKAGLTFYELPVAIDGLTVVTSSKNMFCKSLSLAQLKKLWEPGSKIVTWKDLDASWPDQKIKLYGPGADSGTFEYFTERVVGTAKSSRSDFTASEDDNVLVTGIANDPYALGYFGYAYYSENIGTLKALAIDAENGKGAVLPLTKDIESGAYPLARPLFITVSAKAAAAKHVSEFVSYYLKNAAKYAGEVGYSPLPPSVYKKALENLEQKKTGPWSTGSTH